jgi:hypothetical protein
VSQETHIGDGVYATVDGDIKLRTERHYDRDPVSDIIYLDLRALLTLLELIANTARCHITVHPGENAKATQHDPSL